MDDESEVVPEPRCNFCGCTQRLAASRNEQFFAGQGAYVCGACIRVMAEIMDDEARSSGHTGD